jgi:hypothetical protein
LISGGQKRLWHRRPGFPGFRYRSIPHCVSNANLETTAIFIAPRDEKD